MGHFLAHTWPAAPSLKSVDSQAPRLERYFLGCHPLGIRALILRCKVSRLVNCLHPQVHRTGPARLVFEAALSPGDGA